VALDADEAAYSECFLIVGTPTVGEGVGLAAAAALPISQ
jgi:hypothetical protein